MSPVFLTPAGNMVVTKHGAAAMSGDSEDFDKPYLPERFRLKVKANRRRRLVRRGILCCIFIAVIAAAVLLFGFPSPGWLHVPAPLQGTARPGEYSRPG